MVTEFDVTAPDGRTLHAYDSGERDRLAVFWHHGTPNLGAPPAPLFPDADRLGLRWVSYDRPGYGGSTPRPGRDIASAAADVAALADELGIERFTVLGHSGGGPHALACAALLGDWVLAAVSISGLAPYGADGLDYFAGMAEGGAASLSAAIAGREAKEKFEATDDDLDIGFADADWAALTGDWSWFNSVVGPAIEAGPAALIDDDLAYVNPWGFDPADVRVPTLIGHGGQDRMVPSSHAEWLARRCPDAELRVSEPDGHVSAMRLGPDALAWLRAQVG